MPESRVVVIKSELTLAREALESAESVAAHTLSIHRDEILEGLRKVPGTVDIRNEILDALDTWHKATNRFLAVVSKRGK